jgi:hypothetical protein
VKRIAVLVEGQTEGEFVAQVLQEYFNPDNAADGFWLTPVIVETSRTSTGVKSRGGGKNWRHYDRDLRNLLAEKHWFRVGLLVDYYAYPTDAPGADAMGHARARHQLLLQALAAEYRDGRFVPGIALHEFETLVIASAMEDSDFLGGSAASEQLREVARGFNDDVELINDGPRTAPSKRVLDAWPDYSKTVDGIEAILDAGLDRVLERCPVMREWLERLAAPVT